MDAVEAVRARARLAFDQVHHALGALLYRQRRGRPAMEEQQDRICPIASLHRDPLLRTVDGNRDRLVDSVWRYDPLHIADDRPRRVLRERLSGRRDSHDSQKEK